MKLTLYKHDIKIFLSCITCIFSFYSIHAQPGTIDPTYGENGIFIGRNYGICYAATLQQDGKMLMAGEGWSETYQGFGIVRLTTEGEPDESFGSTGRVVTDFGFDVQVANAITIQPDGKIVLAGVNYEDDKTRNNFLVARYLTDGRLDSSFAEKGWLSTDFNGDDYARSVAVQPDGKIVVAGSNTYRALIARYNTDGTLDGSFGNDGLVITRINSFPVINAMALQGDGKIVLAGTLSSNSNGSVVMCRYLPDGKQDESFGTNGVLVSDWMQSYGEICNALKIQDDGKFILTGVVITNNVIEEAQAIVRYNADGSLDPSFGNEGKSFFKIENEKVRPMAIQVQPDGKIITAGIYSAFQSFRSFYFLRIQSNGEADLSFNQSGFVSSDLGASDWAWSVLLQQDGKIILAGQSISFAPPVEYNFAAIRYNGGEGSLPITYKNFTAIQKNGFIELNWQTANEINNKYFVVERSNTGTTFNEIARVSSTSNGNAANYIYADKLAKDGSNYYRLKQVDKDGKSSYSKTISISFVKTGNIKIQPNPVKDKLIVSGLAAGENNTLMITDMVGNILKKIHTATAQHEINIYQLVPGNYILSVKNNKGNFILKFVKQ